MFSSNSSCLLAAKKYFTVKVSVGVTLLIISGLQGCTSIQTRNDALDKQLATGDFTAAAISIESDMGFKSKDPNQLPDVEFKSRNVLDHLDAGKAWLLAGNSHRALDHFDAAESSLNDIDSDGNFSSGLQQVSGAILGDSTMSYKPSPSESVLINYYKSIIFMEKGDYSNARVELNRAGERTKRAVDRYSRELIAAQHE